MNGSNKGSSETGLATFMAGEIERLEKTNRKTLRIGLLVLLLVGAYLTLAMRFICTQIMDPTGAAQWVAYVAERDLPAVIVETEQTLTQQASTVADHLVSGMVKVPQTLGEQARSHVDVVVDEALPHLALELRDTLNAKFEAEGQDAAEFFAAHTEPELVQAFIDQLGTDLVADLDAHMRADSGQGVQHMTTMTLDALQVIDEQLTHLCEAPVETLSREDLLQRRLIVMCLQSLDQQLLDAQESSGPLFSVQGSL